MPNKSAAKLHITNIVKGSFVFLLEEMQSQGEAIDTALKAAADKSSLLMQSFSGDDEEYFQASVENNDARVLATARELFNLLKQDGATFHLVVGKSDKRFGVNAVNHAAQRPTDTDVKELDETFTGMLVGIFPVARIFEFLADGTLGLIRGKVGKDIPNAELPTFSRNYVEKRAHARIRIKQLLRRDQIAREIFTLLKLDLDD